MARRGNYWHKDSPDGQRTLVGVINVGVATLILLRLQSIGLLLCYRYDGKCQAIPARLDQIHHLFVCGTLHADAIAARERERERERER